MTNAREQWIETKGDGVYKVCWWPKDRLRSPVAKHRYTDRLGAERFAKKHGLEMPKATR